MKKEIKKLKRKLIWARIENGILLSLFILLFLAFAFSYDMINAISDMEVIENIDYSYADKCSNLDLFDTSECLTKQVSTFLIYKKDSRPYITFENLKENGTDCKHWATLYKKYLEYLGFSSKIISMWDEDSGHGFALAYKKGEGWCIIDQSNVKCGKVK